MPNVFLSYSRADKSLVDRIAYDLGSQGIDLWMDRMNLIAGKEWLPQISEAISQADFMVLFLSKFSLSSVPVRNEYEKALENQEMKGGTRLIPVLLEKIDLPESLSKYQYIDFTESYFIGMQQLLKALRTEHGPKPEELFPKGFAQLVADEVFKKLGLEDGRLTQKMKVDPKLIFVITAYRDDLTPIFEGIEAAGNSLGLVVKRVKDIVGDYRITDQIIQMIGAARLVVADLTHESPNVYFELGYARGLGKTVITIAREHTKIHFDVKDWTCIFYTDSRYLERDIQKRFELELVKPDKLGSSD
jgi:hypothetical protein